MSNGTDRIEVEPLDHERAQEFTEVVGGVPVTLVVGPAPVEAPASPAEAIEHWQARRAVPEWKHAGARVLARWGVGQVVSEAQYITAVETFEGHEIGRE